MRITLKDLDLVKQIGERAVRTMLRLRAIEEKQASFARIVTIDELLTVHRDIVPLRLDEMLAADDANLMHDVCGIHRHLDRRTATLPARLNDCFMPRFAAPTI